MYFLINVLASWEYLQNDKLWKTLLSHLVIPFFTLSLLIGIVFLLLWNFLANPCFFSSSYITMLLFFTTLHPKRKTNKQKTTVSAACWWGSKSIEHLQVFSVFKRWKSADCCLRTCPILSFSLLQSCYCRSCGWMSLVWKWTIAQSLV